MGSLQPKFCKVTCKPYRLPLILFLFIFILFLGEFFGEEDNCDTNDWDKVQHCYCGWGKKISVIKSWHSNDKEDRRYNITCTGIPGNIGGFSGDTW